jgi:hypothetical protein
MSKSKGLYLGGGVVFLAALWAVVLISSPKALGQTGFTATLYAPAPDRPALSGRQVDLPQAGALTQRVVALTRALLEERPDGDPALFNGAAALRQAYVDQARLAYLDLAVAPDKRPGLGAAEAYWGVMALVNTICLNLPEIHGVKILVNGDEAPTLFGHLDISRPFTPDDGMVESNGPR